MKVLAVIILAIALLGLFIRNKINKDAVDLAAKTLQEVTPWWAAQGPFENGTESAAAMWIAWAAAYSVERAQTQNETLLGHRRVFDEDPEAWEAIRQQALKQNPIEPYMVPLIEALEVSAKDNGYLEWLTE